MMSYQTQSARERDDPACTEALRSAAEHVGAPPTSVFVDPRTGAPSVTLSITLPVVARDSLEMFRRVSGRSPEEQIEMLIVQHCMMLAELAGKEWVRRQTKGGRAGAAHR